MEQAWAPLLFKDEDKPVSADVVAPAQRSASALAKASTHRFADGSSRYECREQLG
jgi:hypothetical protein